MDRAFRNGFEDLFYNLRVEGSAAVERHYDPSTASYVEMKLQTGCKHKPARLVPDSQPNEKRTAENETD